MLQLFTLYTVKVVLVLAFWALGIGGAVFHVYTDFLTATPEEKANSEEWDKYWRRRKLFLFRTCIAFSFVYIIWAGMKGWALSWDKLAVYANVGFGVFMSVIGYVADSIWNKGVRVAEVYAEKKAKLTEEALSKTDEGKP